MSTVTAARLVAETDGEGPVIVFVHGLGGTSNTFQPLLGALSGFRCVRVDLPGSGRSPAPHEPLTIEGMASSVIAAARSLGAMPAHFVGHSMGTLICQHIAAKMPEGVLSMTLFGAVLEPTEQSRQRIRERARLARTEGLQPVADAVSEAGLSTASKSTNPATVAYVRETTMRQDAEAYARTCEALADGKAADTRLITCPTLIINGDEDVISPPSAAQSLSEKIKGAKLKLLDRCGHWPSIERPLDSAQLLAGFLKDSGR